MNEKNQASTITSGKCRLFPIMGYVNGRVFSETRTVLFRGPVRLSNKHSFDLVLIGLRSPTSQSSLSRQLCKVDFHMNCGVLSESEESVSLSSPYNHIIIFSSPPFPALPPPPPHFSPSSSSSTSNFIKLLYTMYLIFTDCKFVPLYHLTTTYPCT